METITGSVKVCLIILLNFKNNYLLKNKKYIQFIFTMFTLFLLFSIFTLSEAHVMFSNDYCNYNSIDRCLDTYFCSWCNISTTINNTQYFVEQCVNSNDICTTNFSESSMCIYQDNYKESCSFYETLMIFMILFILITSSYSITYSLTKNFSFENQTRICGFAIVIALLVNIPAFILWTTYSQYLGVYLLCLIIISFIACCTNSTRTYIHYKKTKREGYELINNQ